jgi:membrane protein required for colicin V production
LDLWVVTIPLFLSLVGLARGFLKEIVSILNWFGSFYFTSLAKPIAVELLRSRITTPFLLDIVSNTILFVFFAIAFSLLSNYVVNRVGRFIPGSVNRILGLAFGCIKGALISMVILASVNILYRNPSINDPIWLQNSIAYQYFDGPKGSVFVKILERIFGDMIREENNDEKIDGTIENDFRQKLDEKIEDITKDIILNSPRDKNNENEMDSKGIEHLLDKIVE